MKLKTEVRQGDDMVVPIAAGDEFDQFNAYCHDAAYAHAILQAVNELGEKSNYWTNYGPTSDQQQWIFERADELMAEWGYREE